MGVTSILLDEPPIGVCGRFGGVLAKAAADFGLGLVPFKTGDSEGNASECTAMLESFSATSSESTGPDLTGRTRILNLAQDVNGKPFDSKYHTSITPKPKRHPP